MKTRSASIELIKAQILLPGLMAYDPGLSLGAREKRDRLCRLAEEAIEHGQPEKALALLELAEDEVIDAQCS